MNDANEPTPVNMEQALLDPEPVCAAPEAVLLNEALTTQQKIEILRRWEYDASENCVAVEEGMLGGESDLLRRILLALDQLAGSVDVEHVRPTKQHGILRSIARAQPPTSQKGSRSCRS